MRDETQEKHIKKWEQLLAGRKRKGQEVKEEEKKKQKAKRGQKQKTRKGTCKRQRRQRKQKLSSVYADQGEP